MVGSRIYGGKRTRHHLFPHLLGVDLTAGEGVDMVLDMEEPVEIGEFFHVECTSVLEHSRRPWLLAANIEHVMLPGATLYVSVPFCWRLHGTDGSYGGDYWRMSVEGVRSLFRGIEWTALMYADRKLHEKPRIPAAEVDGHYYLARSEVVGFGHRR